MKHAGTQIIETDRLILRQFNFFDAFDAFRNWTSDKEVTKYITWQPHSDVDVTKKIVQEWVDGYERKNYYQWAIVLKEINQPIGSIGVVDQIENIKLFHIGYCIGSKWWHQGIMTEAFKAVIDYLFTKTGVNRIEAAHDIKNPNSGCVMKKCGMQLEGVLKQAGFNNRGIIDLCLYSILRKEWKKLGV